MATANEVHDTREGVLSEELDVLESIYIKELTVERDDGSWPSTISVLLHPATGMDDSKKFVCMTVVFQVPHNYPDELPEIKIRNPRGMCEEELQSLLEDMKQMAKERLGGPMLFELIEMAKDCLTDGNIPHCECAICLEHFMDGDLFVKTDCYHYFHRHCLARYAAAYMKKRKEEEEASVPHASKNQDEKSLSCPMCRLPLTCNLNELLSEPIPPEPEVTFLPTKELLNQQTEMAALYAAQKAKGGIIDLTEEKKKFLVDENTVVSLEKIQKSETHGKGSPSKKKRIPPCLGHSNTGRRDERGHTDKENVDRKNLRQDGDGRYHHRRAAGRLDKVELSLQEGSEEKESQKSRGWDGSSHGEAGRQKSDGYYRGRYYRGASNARQHYMHVKENTDRSSESSQEPNNRDPVQEKQLEHGVQHPKGRREHGYGRYQRQRRYPDQREGTSTGRDFDKVEGDHDRGNHQGDSEDRAQSKSGDNHSETSFREGKESVLENRKSSWHKEANFHSSRHLGNRYHPPHREYGQANQYRRYNDFRHGHSGRGNRGESEGGNFEDNEQDIVTSEIPRNSGRNERPSSARSQEHEDRYRGQSDRVDGGKNKGGNAKDNEEKDIGWSKNFRDSAMSRSGCKGKMPVNRDAAYAGDRESDLVRDLENDQHEGRRPGPSVCDTLGSDHSARACPFPLVGCERSRPLDTNVYENDVGGPPTGQSRPHQHPQGGNRLADKPRGKGQERNRNIPFKNKQTYKAADEAGTKSIKSTSDSCREEKLPAPPGFKVMGPPPGFSKNDNVILP